MAKLIDLDGLAYFYGKIKAMLADKLGKNDTAAAAIKDGAGNTISTTYASKADVSALLSTKLGVTATAYAATRDGAGNNIADTYAKKTDIPNITVDAELSSTSTNPVQNKVIKEALDGKLGKNETAARATQDGAGNTITETYAKKTDISGVVKSVNGTKPDTNGNVTVEEYTHPNSGVTAGTYRSVTVNAQGHVTGGSNPTLAIANGGTGATTASAALSNLGGVPTSDVANSANKIPRYNSSGHLVLPDGSEFWIA